jgi:adenylate cyclase
MIPRPWEGGSLASFNDFITELRRRRVFRALLVWGIAAFAVLQVYEPIMHGLHLPEWTLSFVVVALGLGFPIAAALAWVFDLKATGIERTPPAASEEQASSMSRGARRARLALLLLGLGAAAAAPGLVYFFAWPATGRGPALGATAATMAADPSIAVLPLVNLSSDKEQEYFSDGLTEELLNLLAKVPGLRVASRTSAFAFKGKNVRMSEIGRELGVATVLEGSVRKSGDQIRITTQLISAGDGYHLWSETYDRRITDVFVVQDEIATAVVRALKLKLLKPSGAQERRTESVEAHDLYLRGLYFWNLRTGESLLRAAEFFRAAIKADPGYALAHVGLADAIEIRTAYAWVRDDALRAQAKAAATRALELDPELGEAHASLGMMLSDEFDRTGALEHYRRAIALRPDYATAHHWYAMALSDLGRADEARKEIEHALRLDPTSRIINTNAGRAALLSRDCARAEGLYRAALERSAGRLRIRPERARHAVCGGGEAGRGAGGDREGLPGRRASAHPRHRLRAGRPPPGGAAAGRGAGGPVEEDVRPGSRHCSRLGVPGRPGQGVHHAPAGLPGAGWFLGTQLEGGPGLRRAEVRSALRRDPRLLEPAVNGRALHRRPSRAGAGNGPGAQGGRGRPGNPGRGLPAPAGWARLSAIPPGGLT